MQHGPGEQHDASKPSVVSRPAGWGLERNPALAGGTKYYDPPKMAPNAEPIQLPVTAYTNIRPVRPCSSCAHGIGATQDYWTVEGKNLCSACFEARYPGWRSSWGRA